MPFYSPLRYPGGKNKLAKFIAMLCEKNDINGHYVEPYAGGASVALFLLLEGIVSKITINDKDPSIHAFWYSIINFTDEFCDLIEKCDINVESWQECKRVQNNRENASLLQLGFSTFFLNRTNISGILDAGIIGGLNQKGKYKIDCRFNKNELIKRIRKIAESKNKIKIYNLDALDLIKKLQKESCNSTTIFYFDPPYFIKGESLYLNHYKEKDHDEVSKAIQNIKNARWIVSYDNTPEVKNLYKNRRRKVYSLLHTARTAKKGREILFFSDNLYIPQAINPAS